MNNTITLTQKLEYHTKQGEIGVAEFVTILPPTAKYIQLTSILKQAFQVSISSIGGDNGGEEKETTEKDDSDKITPSMAVSILYAGGCNVDIKQVMATARELMTSGLVLVEGEENLKFTKPLCDKLSPDDFEEILGTFLINFIVKSLLKATEKEEKN